MLAVVGGNFYFATPVPVRFRDTNVVAFTRDEQDRLLLETNMLSTSHDTRMAIQENFWVVRGNPVDLECPPNGRLVTADYANGDKLRVEFIPDLTLSALASRYPDADIYRWGQLPQELAVVEIQMKVGGTEIDFGPRETRMQGNNIMRNCFSSHCGVGIQMG